MSYQKTSPWVYVGAGCGVILVLGLIVLAVLGFFGYRFARDIGRGLTDPQVREERVKALLGSDELPAGYYPAVSLSIPVILDLAILTDVPPGPSGEIEGVDEWGFIYLKVVDFGDQRRELLDFLEGRSEEFQLLEESKVSLERHQFIGRGRFEGRSAEVIFASYRADLELNKKRRAGIASLFTVDCPGRGKLPIGVWFGPDPAAGQDIMELDINGTPADEEALRSFLENFELCGIG